MNGRRSIRIVCLVLVGLMILGLVPVLALAATDVASVTADGVTTGYPTVQQAVDAAAASGGIVTVLADVELETQVSFTSGTVTFDLAGHKLANYVSNGGHVLYVNGANVTVKDSSADKTGTLTPNGSSIYNAGIHLDSGNVTVDGVICSGGYLAVAVAGGTMTINDITTDEDISVTGGELIVNGGSMEQLDMSGGETTVNGGYFSTTSGTTYLIYLNGGNITVNGGTWRFCDNYGIFFNDADSECYIRGGIYTNGLKMSINTYTGLDMYLPDILDPGFYLYDDAGDQIELSYDTKKVTGYVAVAQTSPGPRIFSVTYTLTGLTSTNTSTTIQKGYSLFTTLTAQEGYTAPSSIRVKMDGSTLSTSKYSYADGNLSIMSANISGDIEIIATAVEKWTYTVVGLDGDGTMTETDGIYIKTYTAVPVGEDYEICVAGSSISDSTQSASVTFDVTAQCDVTVTYDPSTGETTVTGDGVTQDVITHRVIYFDNASKGWSRVNIYAWNGDGDLAGAWPGTAMSLLEGTTGIYYYILPVEAVNVIFNDGSSQTGDLTLPDLSLNMYDASGNWVYYDGQVEICSHPSHGTDGACSDCGTYVGHTYVDGICVCGAIEPTEPDPGERMVYFRNTAGWSTPYIYTWTKDNGTTTEFEGGWPGAAMIPVEGVDGLYCYTISTEAVNVIFHNNSGTQTGDLVLPTDGKDLYDYSTSSWSAYAVETPCGHPSHDRNGICSDCGETVSHSYNSVPTAPTCTEEGYTTYTCTVCGHSYTADIVPVSNHRWSDGVCGSCGAVCVHNFVDGVCTVCTMAEPMTVPTLTLSYPSLSFEDEIKYNVYFSAEGLDDVVEMGLITFDSRLTDGTIADAADVICSYSTDGTSYMVQTSGIAAAYMGDTLYFKVYAKLSDGTYVYSDLAGYNAVAYAKTILDADSSSDSVKRLVVSMLNYGAQAQLYFGHNTDSLMNSSLAAAQQALVSAYDETMVDDVTAADPAKTGNFTPTDGAFGNMYPSVSFDGAFSINYYFTTLLPVDGDVTFYYWDTATYDSVTELTAENATGTMTMKATGQENQYWANVTGIAAKQIDETYYAAGVYESDGTVCTTGIISYSLGRYCEGIAADNSSDYQAFAQATAVYGYYAKQYFANL